ncbi:caspase family protein [uncultured Tenacibaculum sp.]|uniref:caspase family protein n=1 Tax=uncultured Tenacibaculum sp. TaxID=174713 RepID=UPI0026051892|nr:caspase family protein [uncultured Tenacibaculum sp.]
MKTIALIIGNNEYHDSAKLDNAINDATSINKEFERLGFTTIFKCDCKSTDYPLLLSDFEKRIPEFDASIFYYAGHGFELDGINYLSSIDCQIPPADKYSARMNSIMLNEILEIHKKNSTKVNIAIIDACRKSFSRSNSSSLSPLIAPKGSFIAFSTSPNEGANDKGYEGNSIYTGSLLNYLGRERLSIEELFKKVRKTVHSLSQGKQTTWEHTSLISDYYFNTGQRVHSITIPYHESVVKDVNYDTDKNEFSLLIKNVRILNYYKQNPAIDNLLDYKGDDLDKNQQFILGRNLLQSSRSAYSSSDFFDLLEQNISKYTKNKENHLLNGILYEIYFNSYGEYRGDNRKDFFLEEILKLRKKSTYKNSFKFIADLLNETEDKLVYLPQEEDISIDIDVLASEKNTTNNFNETISYQVISSIIYNGIDITEKISTYNINGLNELGLKSTIAKFLTAPIDLIHINSNLKIEKMLFINTTNIDTSKW